MANKGSQNYQDVQPYSQAPMSMDRSGQYDQLITQADALPSSRMTDAEFSRMVARARGSIDTAKQGSLGRLRGSRLSPGAYQLASSAISGGAAADVGGKAADILAADRQQGLVNERARLGLKGSFINSAGSYGLQRDSMANQYNAAYLNYLIQSRGMSIQEAAFALQKKNEEDAKGARLAAAWENEKNWGMPNWGGTTMAPMRSPGISWAAQSYAGLGQGVPQGFGGTHAGLVNTGPSPGGGGFVDTPLTSSGNIRGLSSDLMERGYEVG